MTNIHGEEKEEKEGGGTSLFWDGITFLTKILKPGPGLDGMNQTMIQTITDLLNEFDDKESSTVDSWEWVRHAMTMATTESTYGPLNPYKDEDVEKAFC